ncbi:MAG: glycerate kinase [Tepidisphaeraceae bacterium]
MRVLVAPDKFKGSLDAVGVAEAMARGIRRADPTIEIDRCPLSDGGEGFVHTVTTALGGRFEARRVTGPLPEMKVDATFGVTSDGRTAIIEMSSASGVALLKPEDRNPLATTTFGTGELIRAAVELGCKRILLGIGGSATCDAGIGCLQACGCHVILQSGEYARITEPLCGRDLDDIRMIKSHRGGVPGTGFAGVDGVEIVVACDVTNPLYGPNGSAVVYGPQKGASPEDVQELDRMLREYAKRIGHEDLAQQSGAGAAGGIGFGLCAILGAKMTPGINLVLEGVHFAERVANADVVLIGEGRIDEQSFQGKVIAGVLNVCRKASRPCGAIAGSIADAVDLRVFTEVASLITEPAEVAVAMRDASRLIEDRACSMIKRFVIR